MVQREDEVTGVGFGDAGNSGIGRRGPRSAAVGARVRVAVNITTQKRPTWRKDLVQPVKSCGTEK